MIGAGPDRGRAKSPHVGCLPSPRLNEPSQRGPFNFSRLGSDGATEHDEPQRTTPIRELLTDDKARGPELGNRVSA